MTGPSEAQFISRTMRHRLHPRVGTSGITRVTWVFVWALASIIPILPLTLPLWQDALADTPYAYLVWIPVFAFFWAIWMLLGADSYNDDAELNSLVGVPLVIVAGGALASAVNVYSAIFIGQSVGLLLWPLWALGLAWLLFGIGITGRIIKPLAYLTLAWPPLYTTIVNLTNPPLERLTNVAIRLSAHIASWIQVLPTYGNYLIANAGNWIPVQVTAACSGSDSFLAMVILLPIVLVLFRGSLWRKTILIVIAAFLTIVMNLIRLFALIITLHLTTVNFTFGTLHPILGFILFIISILLLMLFGKWIGLQGRGMKITKSLQSPGIRRGGFAIIASIAMTVLLWPVYDWASGSFASPIPVSTDRLSALMPFVSGYQRNLLGVYNEGAVLGPGAYGTAYAYSNGGGDYAMAEEWWTYNLNSLLSYGVNNCLLFHGDTVLARNTFDIRPGVHAEAFAMLLPASQIGGARDLFEDVVYSFPVRYNGKTAYIRAEFATPIRYQMTAQDPLRKSILHVLQAQFAVNPASHRTTALSATEHMQLQRFRQFVQSFTKTQLEKA